MLVVSLSSIVLKSCSSKQVASSSLLLTRAATKMPYTPCFARSKSTIILYFQPYIPVVLDLVPALYNILVAYHVDNMEGQNRPHGKCRRTEPNAARLASRHPLDLTPPPWRTVQQKMIFPKSSAHPRHRLTQPLLRAAFMYAEPSSARTSYRLRTRSALSGSKFLALPTSRHADHAHEWDDSCRLVVRWKEACRCGSG